MTQIKMITPLLDRVLYSISLHPKSAGNDFVVMSFDERAKTSPKQNLDHGI
jgi:hypothetical protein